MKTSKKAVAAIFLYVTVALIIILNYPFDYSLKEQELYIVLFFSYLVVCGELIVAIIKAQVYLFEPITFISGLYIAIFIYQPLVDVLEKDVSYWGYDVLDGGVKATILFTLGYTIFYFVYYRKRPRTEPRILIRQTSSNKAGVGLLMYWGLFMALCLVCMLSQGMSLQYIFSFGNEGERVFDNGNVALLFLSNFATSLLVVWLMVINRSYPLWIKICITAITGIYLVMRNGRWLMLIMLLAPFTYYYTRRKKSPKMLPVVICLFGFLVMFAWMQNSRGALASGGAVQDWEGGRLTLKQLTAPFESDFTTYTTFYGMTINYPKNVPYMEGKTYMYVFQLFIPRALWPGKPDNPVRDMIGNALGSIAQMNGRAVVNFGEAYANFGTIGVMIYMAAFGEIMGRLKNFYHYPTENRLIMYAVLYPLLFQWVARGNFSGNIYYTLFAFAPMMISWAWKKFKEEVKHT